MTSASLVGWHLLVPLLVEKDTVKNTVITASGNVNATVKNTISIKGNNSSQAVIAQGNVTVNSNVPPEVLAKYDKYLRYLEQGLAIQQELGDKAGEGRTLNNIATAEYAQGDYATALKHLEQSLRIRQEIGDKAGEGTTLNNIGKTYDARGDYATALKYLEQSLRIRQEIGDKRGEAVTSWNIGRAYEEQGDLHKAESYISRAVQLMEDIGHPKLDKCRKVLVALRAQLKAQ